jgi:accessory gene regulator B
LGREESNNVLESFAIYFTEKLNEKNLIKEDLIDWYIFSYVRLLETGICLGTLLVISLFLHNTFQAILFLLFLYILRTRTGGFHCKTFIGCYITSCIFFIILSMIEPYIKAQYTLFRLLMLISAIVIFFIGTVNHPNIAFDYQELKESKKIARYILECELTAIFLIHIVG